MAKKKWYESGWFWAAAGVGVFLFLRSRKASAAPGVLITKIPPPWDPADCSPVSASVKPYIDKFKKAAEAVYGSGSAGEVCVEIVTVPGLTLDERTTITLQIYPEDDTALDLDTLKSRSHNDLVVSIKELRTWKQ